MKRRNFFRHLKCSLVLLLLLQLTGCWSSKEIEELGLVAGTALDLEKKADLSEEIEGQEERYPNRVMITITNQLITSQTTESGKKTGAPQQKSFKNVSETGDSILPILRKMILKIDKRAFAQHSKVIVIGEDLTRTLNLQQILDFFLREQEMRLSGLILIAKNNAKKTLESQETTVIPAFHLFQITKSQERTTKILPPLSLAKVMGKLHSGSSFLVQTVVSENSEVKFAGAAVIKGKTKKLLGFLNEKELEGLAWLTGKGKGGVVKSFDEETSQPIIYEIKSMKSKIQPRIVNNNISFDVKIESEGSIAEHWVPSGKPFENEFLKKAEKTTEKEVERLVKNILVKTQQNYKVDIAELGNRLRIEYPRVWEKVKKDWDHTFSKIPIKYNVNLTVKDYGTSGSN
ncbi:Ger(x)C family spore germination protein [Neobacillus bataviensis]|uniref:Ger(x)C family spore germination protein n=1 Tax=Neobacillus bataviensis TaxID=220685 RepID=UPI001CBF931C|nr:Ger(x)C family spore germination protein [Neobacillus bataviensis]